ncbi:YcjX family protein [Shewanella sp. FJAT-52076]|uniref:YcjX family protein n=1 Tax=Shewanella sp. FJAT-52076 TaxID=2864202 RepID=UPI001C659A1D|nr:YcjX family protein [Shewanella sp. FJAT-52076]QYJ76583.1 YcjX family protein [Shewanella sp. FJAT-52076]
MASSPVDKLTQKARDLLARSTDRHLRLAVTGLSGAGKTAFITGLVHQLLSATAANDKNLPLWQVSRDERLVGVRRASQPDLNIASFDLQGALAALSHTPPSWPASTRNLSELRLEIRYRPKGGLLSKLSDVSTLYLDLVDYPGEWLLDLPMLRQDYASWSQSVFAAINKRTPSESLKAFIEAASRVRLDEPLSDEEFERIAGLYRAYLEESVHSQGYYFAQPGRMLLPGELEGAPLLAFFPLPLDDASHKRAAEAGKDSAYGQLCRRYREYVDAVVEPFFKRHFARFDRQLVLVDCFSALNRGRAQFEDMSLALDGILESFRFGQSSLIKRLFSPRIDKLLFAASKIDHVTRDQQGRVLGLLKQMLGRSEHFARFEGCQVEAMAISAIRATRPGMVNTENGEVEVVTGTELATGKPITLFPGEVPQSLPKPDFWQNQGFEFVQFAPMARNGESPMAHIRLDHLLEYLLGDKLA